MLGHSLTCTTTTLHNHHHTPHVAVCRSPGCWTHQLPPGVQFCGCASFASALPCAVAAPQHKMVGASGNLYEFPLLPAVERIFHSPLRSYPWKEAAYRRSSTHLAPLPCLFCATWRHQVLWQGQARAYHGLLIGPNEASRVLLYASRIEWE